MRTTTKTARGIPLAVLLMSVLVAISLPTWGGEITVRQTIDRSEVFVSGMGEGEDEAVLTLSIGSAVAGERYPIDLIFIIDTSATAELASSEAFAFDLIERLSPDDRIGLVAYADTAQLAAPLSDDRAAVKAAIADLATGGKSALGAALQAARREFSQNGRSEAVFAVVLLSDGQSNVGTAPDVEGGVAEEMGITIIPVGIGTLINKNLLGQLAADTGGVFYSRPTDRALSGIIDHLTSGIAARRVTVNKVLPPQIALIDSTPRPTSVKANPDGTTSAVWHLSDIYLGGSASIELTLEAMARGSWDTDLDSSVEYFDFRGVHQSVKIPAVTLTAIEPNHAPKADFAFSPEDPNTMDTVMFVNRSLDDDGEVTGWEWDFGDGEKSDVPNPEHRFVAPGTYTVSLVAIDDRGARSTAAKAQVTVKNTPPTALFTSSPKEPRSGVETVFDASGSNDIDGHVVTYSWDFDGDGAFDRTTAVPQVSYTFPSSGEVRVTLAATDDSGGIGTYTKVIEVLPSVTAIRTIDTCLPDDVTIAGGTVTVTVTITANTEVNGLSVTETIPDGWTFTAVDDDGATRREAGGAIEWIFFEKLIYDDVDSKREIRYTLTAPSAAPADPEQFAITGDIGSSSPRFSQAIGGEDKLTLVRELPIPVVISRWDAANGKLDPCLGELVGFDQIQYAVSLWLSGEAVPHTDNKSIDLATIQDLIAYWLTGSSVHDPLP